MDARLDPPGLGPDTLTTPWSVPSSGRRGVDRRGAWVATAHSGVAVGSSRKGSDRPVRQGIDEVKNTGECPSELGRVRWHKDPGVAHLGEAEIDRARQEPVEPTVAHPCTSLEVAPAPAVSGLLVDQEGGEQQATSARTERPVRHMVQTCALPGGFRRSHI